MKPDQSIDRGREKKSASSGCSSLSSSSLSSPTPFWHAKWKRERRRIWNFSRGNSSLSSFFFPSSPKSRRQTQIFTPLLLLLVRKSITFFSPKTFWIFFLLRFLKCFERNLERYPPANWNQGNEDDDIKVWKEKAEEGEEGRDRIFIQ